MLQITWKEQKCARQREGTFSGKSQKEKVTRIKYFSHLAPKCVISIRSSLKWRKFIAATSTLVIVSRRDRRPSGLTALADGCCVYFFVLFYELCNQISLKGHSVWQWIIAVAQKQTKRKKKSFIYKAYLFRKLYCYERLSSLVPSVCELKMRRTPTSAEAEVLNAKQLWSARNSQTLLERSTRILFLVYVFVLKFSSSFYYLHVCKRNHSLSMCFYFLLSVV